MPLNYEILIADHLDPCWSEWLEGLSISHPASGGSLLRGPLPDQSALLGLLNRLRDMNLKPPLGAAGAGRITSHHLCPRKGDPPSPVIACSTQSSSSATPPSTFARVAIAINHILVGADLIQQPDVGWVEGGAYPG